MDYNEILLQAINTIVDKRINDLELTLDKTSIGTVTQVDEEKNIITIQIGTETFEVKNEGPYSKGQKLHILTTGTNKERVILGKVDYDTDEDLSTGLNKTYVKVEKVMAEVSTKEANIPYIWNTICLEGDFTCVSEDTKGRYGLTATIEFDDATILVLNLDSSEMFGNPFGFVMPTRQRAYLSVDSSMLSIGISKISIEFYNSVTNAPVPPVCSNISLSFGYFKENFGNDEVQIDAIGGAGYIEDKQEKILRARWYNRSEYAELRWYYGEDEICIGKEQITFETSHAKTEQEITAKVFRKGATAKAVLQDNEKFKYDIILDANQEIKNSDDCYLAITFSDIQSSTENEKIFVFQEKEYKVSAPITWNTNQDKNENNKIDADEEKDVKLFHFRKSGEDEYQANIESLTSPLGTDSITLKNEQVISNAASILGWSIGIKNKPPVEDENGKVTTSYYALDTYSGYYDYDNKLIDDHQRWLSRYIILEPNGKDLPDGTTKDPQTEEIIPVWYLGSTITWMMPQPKNSMLYPGSFQGKGTESEIAYKVTYNITNEADYKIAQQLHYRIKEVYNPALNDNTIICDITLRSELGGGTIRATHTVGFENGKASGTYTLAVYPIRRMCAFTSVDNSGSQSFRAELFDKNGDIIFNKAKDFIWKLNGEDISTDDLTEDAIEIQIAKKINANRYNTLEVSVDPNKKKWHDATITTIYPMTFGNAMNNTSVIHASVPINITYNGAGLLETQLSPIAAYRGNTRIENTETTEYYWYLKGYVSWTENGVTINNPGPLSLSGPDGVVKWCKTTSESKCGQTLCYEALYSKTDNIYINAPQDFAYPTNYYPYIVLYQRTKKSDNTFSQKIVWSSPLIIRQNRYGSEILNNWDGKTKVDDRYILSAAAAFGSKDSENKYSGVILGKVGNIIDGKTQIETGLLGYHEGIQTFGFNTDGSFKIESYNRTSGNPDSYIRFNNDGDLEMKINSAKIILGDQENKNLQGYIDASVNGINASISETYLTKEGSADQTFGWSLTSQGFYIGNTEKPNSENSVLAVNSSGLKVSGQVYSDAGTIGGFQISNHYIKTKDPGPVRPEKPLALPGDDEFVGLYNSFATSDAPEGDSGYVTIGGVRGGTWRFIVGKNFGVLSNGTLCASGAIINGNITATSGKIGNWEVIRADHPGNYDGDLSSGLGLFGAAFSNNTSTTGYYGIAFDCRRAAFTDQNGPWNVFSIGELKPPNNAGATWTETEKGILGTWSTAAFSVLSNGTVRCSDIRATGGRIGPLDLRTNTIACPYFQILSPVADDDVAVAIGITSGSTYETKSASGTSDSEELIDGYPFSIDITFSKTITRVVNYEVNYATTVNCTTNKNVITLSGYYPDGNVTVTGTCTVVIGGDRAPIEIRKNGNIYIHGKLFTG